MEFVGKHRLVAHPDHPPRAIRSVGVAVADGPQLMLTYAVEPAASLVVPAHGPVRADRLWRSTCFELFAKAPDRADYREFNFAPGAAWNAYSFSAWREGMQPLPVPRAPELSVREGPGRFELEVVLDRALLGRDSTLVSLTTIVEEADGTMSYWALAHAPGEPDFHQPACFAAALPAIAAP
jgi:hypothetical protein